MMKHASDCNTQVSGIRGDICNCHPREQSEHTPTPWAAANNWIMRRHPICDIRVAVCDAYTAPKATSDPRDRANAAFIVKAVNAHDKLQRVLRLAQYVAKRQDEGLEITATDWSDLREAILEAEQS